MSLSKPNWLPRLIMVGACVALAALNAQVLITGVDVSPARQTAEMLAAPIANDLELLTQQNPSTATAFPQTLERPLFSPSRRPAQNEKPKVSAASRARAPRSQPTLPEGIELVGILKQSGQQRRALIRSGSSSPSGEWVGVGHVLGEWRLSRIDANSVVLEAEGHSESLSLFPVRQTAR